MQSYKQKLIYAIEIEASQKVAGAVVNYIVSGFGYIQVLYLCAKEAL